MRPRRIAAALEFLRLNMSLINALITWTTCTECPRQGGFWWKYAFQRQQQLSLPKVIFVFGTVSPGQQKRRLGISPERLLTGFPGTKATDFRTRESLPEKKLRIDDMTITVLVNGRSQRDVTKVLT